MLSVTLQEFVEQAEALEAENARLRVELETAERALRFARALATVMAEYGDLIREAQQATAEIEPCEPAPGVVLTWPMPKPEPAPALQTSVQIVTPQPAAAEPAKGRRYTPADWATWARMRDEQGLSAYQIHQATGVGYEAVTRGLAKHDEAFVALPEAEQKHEQTPPVTAEDAAQAITEDNTRPSVEVVEAWAEEARNGTPLKEIAFDFGVTTQMVRAALEAHGDVCRCGRVIGTEDRGVLKGHDGECGYCITERLMPRVGKL